MYLTFVQKEEPVTAVAYHAIVLQHIVKVSNDWARN